MFLSDLKFLALKFFGTYSRELICRGLFISLQEECFVLLKIYNGAFQKALKAFTTIFLLKLQRDK